MPIYEFECGWGHRTEKIFTINDCPEKIKCPTCWQSDGGIYNHVPVFGIGGKADNGWAHKVWSIPGNIQLGKPTRMFQNPRTGEVFPATNEYEKPPKGYKELELKSPIERSKFEKEQQRLVDGKNQFISHHLDSLKSESRKKRHDDLNARMNAVQREVNDETGEVVEFTLESKDQALIKKAMEKSNRKKAKEKKSEVMLAVNHKNANNMDQMK